MTIRDTDGETEGRSERWTAIEGDRQREGENEKQTERQRDRVTDGQMCR